MSDHELVDLAQDVDVRCRLHGDFVHRSGAVAQEYLNHLKETVRMRTGTLEIRGGMSTSTYRSRCELLVPPLNRALIGGNKYEDNDM